MARDRRAYGEKSESDILKDALLDECATLVLWHRAQARLAEITAELDELQPEHERLIGPASDARAAAGKAQELWGDVNWRGKRVEGKDLSDLYNDWQSARGYADRLQEPVHLVGQRISALESEERTLNKVERPELDVLGTLMEALQ